MSRRPSNSARSSVLDANLGLFRCWQEITERVGITSVSVQTSNIGQQITTPEGREALREATTWTMTRLAVSWALEMGGFSMPPNSAQGRVLEL